MFRFVFNSIHTSNITSPIFKLYSTASTKSKPPIPFKNGNQDSFTVSYLINQCGFSMEKAVLASTKYVHFDKPQQPDSVISFFKNQGFNDSQIQKLVGIDPRVLSCNPQKTILPKIQFLRSKGASTKDLARIIVCMPTLFRRSLENCILPSYNSISDFLGSDKDAILAITACARILFELDIYTKPNIQILLGAGMSRYNIAQFMKTRPFLLVQDQDKLKESVKQVQELGMDPKTSSYALALLFLTTRKRSTWNRKMEAYKRWGCTEDDVLRSFQISPHIMNISEEKINGTMTLFVHEMGWESKEVVKRYFMFTLSLKKRMIPRWLVYKELLSKGLVQKEINMSTVFTMKEGRFLEKFVNCYKDEAPLLLKLYFEKQALK